MILNSFVDPPSTLNLDFFYLSKKMSKSVLEEKTGYQIMATYVFFLILIFYPMSQNIYKMFFNSKSHVFQSDSVSFSFPNSYNGPKSELITDFHNIYLMSIMTSITVFVFLIFFFEKSYKNFSKKSISSFMMEIYWIIFPLTILFFIGLPSMGILYELEDSGVKDSNLCIKTTGFQWFWSYENKEGEMVESYMVSMEEEDSMNNMNTDGFLKILSNETVNNSVTSKDVMHSWTLPCLKIKMDAIPGRLNQLSFLVDSFSSSETLMGQCSELCGVNHSFMPIVVKLLN